MSAIKDEGQKKRTEVPHTAHPESAAGPTPAPAAASEHTAPEDDAVPPLDDEDSCVLLDALRAVRKQEERLAADTKPAVAGKAPGEHTSPQGWNKKQGKAVTGNQCEADAQKDSSSRKDRMRSTSSEHAANTKVDLFGKSAGSFEALGLQKARLNSLLSPVTTLSLSCYTD